MGKSYLDVLCRIKRIAIRGIDNNNKIIIVFIKNKDLPQVCLLMYR